jgi:aminobenzoyl-glutamate transport protein
VGPERRTAGGGLRRLLDLIERVGNNVPHPAVLFLVVCAGVIVLSALLNWAGWSATYEVVQPPHQSVEQVSIGGFMLPGELLPAEQAPASSYHLVTETAKVQSLVSVDGLRFLFTSFISNFMGFTAVGIILIVMIGVGVAEVSGLISSLIHRLVAVSSAGALTYIIVLLGIISSIASDAGYLVLIPLGSAATRWSAWPPRSRASPADSASTS